MQLYVAIELFSSLSRKKINNLWQVDFE